MASLHSYRGERCGKSGEKIWKALTRPKTEPSKGDSTLQKSQTETEKKGKSKLICNPMLRRSALS